MTIHATRLGTETRDHHAQRPCARCGRLRQWNRHRQSVLCRDCRDTCRQLGELHLWEAS